MNKNKKIFTDEDFSFKKIVLENFDNNQKFLSLVFLPLFIFLYLFANTWTRPLIFIAKKLHDRYGGRLGDMYLFAGVIGFIIYTVVIPLIVIFCFYFF